MTWKSLFWPQQIYSTGSSFNSKIEVRKFLGKRFLRVNGVTQSGGIAEDIYKKIFPLPNSSLPCHSEPRRRAGRGISLRSFAPIKSGRRMTSGGEVLILGFGGGSFAKLINVKYPQANIVGVEIDKKIIDIAKKYFEIEKIKNLTLVNTDAIEFVNDYYDTAQYHSKFDLIFVDLYHGEDIEKRTETESFLKNLKKLLNKNGIVIFNRLNFKKHKKENEKFLEKLKGLFETVITKKAYSNLIVYAFKKVWTQNHAVA